MVSTNSASCAQFPKKTLPFYKTVFFHFRTVYAGVKKDPGNFFFPELIIGFVQGIDQRSPEPGQVFFVRKEGSLVHNPPRSRSPGIQDEQAPAPVIPADRRAGVVDRAAGFPVILLVPQEWACLRMFRKNAVIQEEVVFILIDGNCRFLPGIFVVDQKRKPARNFLYGMDLAHVMTALTALPAFKNHIRRLPDHRMLCQMASPNSRAIRMMITHSRKFECWIRTSSESME